MEIRKTVKSLRSFRRYHRWIGIALALFLFISALSGILLAWKKNVVILQPATQKGQANNLSDWKSLDALAAIATTAFLEEYPGSSAVIDRMDVRPSKGIVKIILDKGWWEIQVDGSTGKVLSIARRHSDWIEAVHDGSIIGDLFKLISMNALGIGLIVMVSSGWWLWYGPKKIRKEKRIRSK